MNVGDFVRVKDHTEWDGLYGVIHAIDGDMALVYCVTHPDKLHEVPLMDLENFNP